MTSTILSSGHYTCRYLFAVIGTEAFHGLSTQPCSDYHQVTCGLGFRTLKCSCYTLVLVVINNNWSNVMIEVVAMPTQIHVET